MPRTVSRPALRVVASVVALLLSSAVAPAATAAVPAAAGDASAWNLIPADNGTQRGNYAYDVEPGQTLSDALVITNSGTEQLDLTLYASDAFTTPEGVLDLRLADEPKTDSGAWITLAEPSVSLQPGESREVAFSIAVPADARPGDHPAGVITSLTSAEAGSSLAVDRRLGIRVHLRVAGDLAPRAEVSGASATYAPSWNPFAGGDLTVTYTLANTGDTRVTAADAVALAGPLGIGSVAAVPQATAEVLPGSAIVVERTFHGVAPLGWLSGTLTVAPEAVGLGAQMLDAISVEVSTTTVSWALIALLVLLAVVALLVVLLVRRARRRKAAAAAASSALA